MFTTVIQLNINTTGHLIVGKYMFYFYDNMILIKKAIKVY